MTELKGEAICLIIALAITLGYTVSPGPYWMGAFTFVAQPMFGLVALGYLWRVLRDLKSKGIL